MRFSDCTLRFFSYRVPLVHEFRKLYLTGTVSQTPGFSEIVTSTAIWAWFRGSHWYCGLDFAERITLNRGSALNGRQVSATECARCHERFGVGNGVGPDLTESGEVIGHFPR